MPFSSIPKPVVHEGLLYKQMFSTEHEGEIFGCSLMSQPIPSNYYFFLIYPGLTFVLEAKESTGMEQGLSLRSHVEQKLTLYTDCNVSYK